MFLPCAHQTHLEGSGLLTPLLCHQELRGGGLAPLRGQACFEAFEPLPKGRTTAHLEVLRPMLQTRRCSCCFIMLFVPNSCCSFLLLVVMPFATSSFLLLVICCKFNFVFCMLFTKFLNLRPHACTVVRVHRLFSPSLRKPRDSTQLASSMFAASTVVQSSSWGYSNQ